MNDKPNAIEVGSWDQIVEGMKDTAKIGRRYFEVQLAAGFNEAQALKLTAAFNNRMIFGETQQ